VRDLTVGGDPNDTVPAVGWGSGEGFFRKKRAKNNAFLNFSSIERRVIEKSLYSNQRNRAADLCYGALSRINSSHFTQFLNDIRSPRRRDAEPVR
jgi:hypothetical protein